MEQDDDFDPDHSTDASPLGLVIDAAVISSFCDGAVLIIAANEISYKFAAGVKEQLEKANCKILGAVLNRVPVKSSSKYYGQKYGRYGAYGAYGSLDEADTNK